MKLIQYGIVGYILENHLCFWVVNCNFRKSSNLRGSTFLVKYDPVYSKFCNILLIFGCIKYVSDVPEIFLSFIL